MRLGPPQLMPAQDVQRSLDTILQPPRPARPEHGPGLGDAHVFRQQPERRRREPDGEAPSLAELVDGPPYMPDPADALRVGLDPVDRGPPDDQLDVGAGLAQQGRGLQGRLTRADDRDPAAGEVAEL